MDGVFGNVRWPRPPADRRPVAAARLAILCQWTRGVGVRTVSQDHCATTLRAVVVERMEMEVWDSQDN